MQELADSTAACGPPGATISATLSGPALAALGSGRGRVRHHQFGEIPFCPPSLITDPPVMSGGSVATDTEIGSGGGITPDFASTPSLQWFENIVESVVSDLEGLKITSGFQQLLSGIEGWCSPGSGSTPL
jgi:hypothetical protein